MIANARARVTPDLATSREFYELPWKMREIAALRALRDSLRADTPRNVLSWGAIIQAPTRTFINAERNYHDRYRR